MNISWERTGGLIIGLGFWIDDGVYLIDPDQLPTWYYLNIYLIFGYIEIRIGG